MTPLALGAQPWYFAAVFWDILTAIGMTVLSLALLLAIVGQFFV